MSRRPLVFSGGVPDGLALASPRRNLSLWLFFQRPLICRRSPKCSGPLVGFRRMRCMCRRSCRSWPVRIRTCPDALFDGFSSASAMPIRKQGRRADRHLEHTLSSRDLESSRRSSPTCLCVLEHHGLQCLQSFDRPRLSSYRASGASDHAAHRPRLLDGLRAKITSGSTFAPRCSRPVPCRSPFWRSNPQILREKSRALTRRVEKASQVLFAEWRVGVTVTFAAISCSARAEREGGVSRHRHHVYDGFASAHRHQVFRCRRSPWRGNPAACSPATPFRRCACR